MIGQKEGQFIWHPILEFDNLLNYEKSKIYGDSYTHSLWYNGNQSFQYSEEIKLTFFCNFYFSDFPFDSHICQLEYGDDLYGLSEITLNTAKIGYGGSMSTLGKDPIIIKNSPFPYEFQLEAIPSFEKVYNGYGAYSYTGMTFNLRRKSLGQLLSGYYYPTGSFAVLSLISFLINPDQVTY